VSDQKVDSRVKGAYQPMEDAMRLHPFYKGKLEVVPKCAIRSLDDFSIWYSPGVAAPCKAIHADPELAHEHTNKANAVAVVSDGTRVLGLGDIGPEAALPVMEGKAILFKYLGGVDAYPICLDTKDPDEIIRTVKILQPSFGGINLEDIAKPKCFRILDQLRAEARIPVWHDDQQGTAAVTLAGLLNALEIVGKRLGNVHIVLNGAGASNLAVARLLLAAGAHGDKMILVDKFGALHRGMTELQSEDPVQYELASRTNPDKVPCPLCEVIRGADVLISFSQPGPGIIHPDWIRIMAPNAIVFACANPVPEIWPWEALEAGAAVVATGRSDFPNQVNNSIGFPGIFRGVLDVRATTITDEMCLAASMELAACAREKGLRADKILPTMMDFDIYPRVAVAVGQKAIEQGVARRPLTAEQAMATAVAIIERARRQTDSMLESGIIKTP